VTSKVSHAFMARHELKLSWRDWIGMMTGGRRGRMRVLAIAFLGFTAFMHLIAYGIVETFAEIARHPDKQALVIITGSALLSWSLMLSQAMEMVTRAFYARADLDLLLSSPVPARRVFAIRILAVTTSTCAMAAALAGPFINALAYAGGLQWLLGYGVIAAMGAMATALATAVTVALFTVFGARRTRVIAQIVAAIVGAAFVIGIQAAAILSTGTLSRFAVLRSETLLRYMPDANSLVWLPARAISGDLVALIVVLAISLTLLALVIILLSDRFAEQATAAAGASHAPSARATSRKFLLATPAQTLRRKEWVLLRRDPWLISQTLMQILYLFPPALLLWRNFGEDTGPLIVLVPVFVMAAGQLAGGLAWLAVSGEDAPDLVASAPVSPRNILKAKIEAVMIAIALALAPFILALAIASFRDALVALSGILIAAGSATMIQLWYRTQARRSHFRRRQISSRMATFAEALSSIAWAATAGLVAAGTWLAFFPGMMAVAILGAARLLRPRPA
jgi:ABC-2 type transport system permease protein